MKSVSEGAESAVGGDQVLQLLDRVLCLGGRGEKKQRWKCKYFNLASTNDNIT